MTKHSSHFVPSALTFRPVANLQYRGALIKFLLNAALPSDAITLTFKRGVRFYSQSLYKAWLRLIKITLITRDPDDPDLALALVDNGAFSKRVFETKEAIVLPVSPRQKWGCGWRGDRGTSWCDCKGQWLKWRPKLSHEWLGFVENSERSLPMIKMSEVPV